MRLVCVAGMLHIELDNRSPQGLRRFLDLVRDGFFKDQVIFHAGAWAQFGISRLEAAFKSLLSSCFIVRLCS